MEYETLLDKAKAKLPHTMERVERFEMPKASGHIQGNRTIIVNFSQICSAFSREPQHILKYLQRELATQGYIDGQRLVLGSKIPSALINQKIEQYAHDFVLCSACKKPDTKIIREGRVLMLKCTACGAKHPIKTKI